MAEPKTLRVRGNIITLALTSLLLIVPSLKKCLSEGNPIVQRLAKR